MMSQVWDNFCKCVETQGKPGEEAFSKYLIKKYGAKNVKDVSEVAKWQQKSVDFLVRDVLHNGEILHFEVKNDYAHCNTGNFVVEYKSDIWRKKIGWWPKIVAANLDNHFIAYRDAYSGETFIVDCAELKEYLKNNVLRKVRCFEKNNSKCALCGILPENTILWDLDCDYIIC